MEAAVDYSGTPLDYDYPTNASDHLLLGCRVLADVDDPENFTVDYTSAMVDELAVWRWRLRDKERPFFVGGHGIYSCVL